MAGRASGVRVRLGDCPFERHSLPARPSGVVTPWPLHEREGRGGDVLEPPLLLADQRVVYL